MSRGRSESNVAAVAAPPRRRRASRAALAFGAVFAIALTGAGPKIAPPVVRTLPNGLRVVVFRRSSLPIVQAQLQVPAGLTAEPPGHGGLAYLTAQLLRQGTTSRSAADFATELDTLGATLGINVNRDVAQVAVGCRDAEFESALELVSDAVVNPLFSDEAFLAARRQIAGQLGQQLQNAALLADEKVAAVAFGSHPYGRSLRGDLDALLGMTRENVRDFHRERWRPDHAVLAIAGAIDPERAFAAANEWFGRWSGAAAPEAHLPAIPVKSGTFLEDLPGSRVTEIRAAVLGPGRVGGAAYPGWVVAREALEGGLLPRGAHATLLPARDATMLVVSATARPESTAAVAGRVRAALRAFAAAPPAGAALEAARRRAAGAWPLSLETLGQLLASWLAGDNAGLPVDHLATMPEALLAADCAGPARAIGAGMTLLLAGPAQKMQGRLASLGPVEALAGDEGPAMAAPAVAATPEQRRRGRELVTQAIAAHGGAAKLAAVHSSELDGDMTLTVGGQDVTGESRYLRVDPARLAYTTRLLELEHRQVLDNDRGWALSMAGDSASLVRSDSTALIGLRSIFETDLVHLLRAASAPGAEPVATGRGAIDGKPVDRVEFVAPHSGRVRLSLDPATHRLVALEVQPTPQGEWRDRRQWAEYVQVEGVWWPRQEVRLVDGEKITSTTLRHIVVNGPVDTMLFRRPIVARGELRGVE